ncbi:MAG: exodeoxyribonuclease V subunit gamma, partial [Clostridia bacterium]|nr:exodeoxyribonuclease V subunit gamma [Clostridia bacterium]
MLSFIFGTDEGQKLNEIYKLAATDAAHGKSVFILVPEQYSMHAEARLISEMGLSAQNKIQILTFSRLCNLVFSKMGPLRTKYIDKAGKFIMTRKALNLCADNLEFFKRSIHRHGFAGLIQRTVSEFKRYGVSPQNLTDFAKETQDVRFSMKLRDLSLIYQQFNTLVDQNHANAEDNLSLIIPKLSKADFLNGSFYITFFKSFTPTEYAVICELMLKSDVCVALSAENPAKKSTVFKAQQKTYQNLVAWTKQHGIPTATPVFLSEAQETELAPDLIHLKKNFFEPSPMVYEKQPKHIHISRPRNFRSEVNDCARLIKQLVREKGYSFNDILILTGNMENYEFLIPQIFDEHRITYFLDRKTPLTSSPFIRMIIAILEILAYGFSYDRIMLIARSGFWGISTEDVDKFENYILAADIPHQLWTSRQSWTYNPDKYQFDMEHINSVKSALIHPLLDLSDMFSGRKTASVIHDNLCSWLTSNRIPQMVSKKIDDFKAASQPEQAENLRLVWNSFVSVMGQMRDYMANEKTTFTEFYEIFTSACSELSVGMIPPTQDKVIISSIDLFRSIGTKAVIVLGALDGVFPRDYATEGLLTDAERNTMKDFGLNLAPDTFTKQQEEQFLIYSVLSTAREYLHIYAPLSDRDGKGLRPSEIIRTLTEDIFPQLNIEESPDDTVQSIESRTAAFNRLAVKLFENNMEVSGLSPLWKTVFNLLENDTDFAPRLLRLKEMSRATSTNTPLSLKTARKLYGSNLVFSVSKLEKYNACAFSFFMRYGLLAQERLLGGLNPSDTGNILHSVLCDYFKGKAEENADYSAISREDCYAEIS